MPLAREEKRIRIAKSIGWVKRIYGSWGEPNIPPDHITHLVYDDVSELPDFFNDLDACHEMETKVPPQLASFYSDSYEVKLDREARKSGLRIWCASAANRAEAFGLTLGLWKENE